MSEIEETDPGRPTLASLVEDLVPVTPEVVERLPGQSIIRDTVMRPGSLGRSKDQEPYLTDMRQVMAEIWDGARDEGTIKKARKLIDTVLEIATTSPDMKQRLRAAEVLRRFLPDPPGKQAASAPVQLALQVTVNAPPVPG